MIWRRSALGGAQLVHRLRAGPRRGETGFRRRLRRFAKREDPTGLVDGEPPGVDELRPEILEVLVGKLEAPLQGPVRHALLAREQLGHRCQQLVERHRAPHPPRRCDPDPHDNVRMQHTADAHGRTAGPDERQVRVSVVAASRNLRSPATAAPRRPSGPSLRPAILAPAPRPPESLLLKTMP